MPIQNDLAAALCSALARIGDTFRRLPNLLYAIAEAVDRLNAASKDDERGGRLAIFGGARLPGPLQR